MRGVVLLAVAAGCSSAPTCFLEDVITDRVGAQDLHDCGTADPTTPIADVQAIHDCVVADQTAMTPFRAVDNLPGTNDRPAIAYLGLTVGGVWHVYELDAHDYSSVDHDHMPSTTTYECPTGLSAISPCDDATLRASLCLRCDTLALLGSCPGQ